MIELGMACDGGKDSLSMAAVADKEVVKAPGQLVISAYAPCPDITGAWVLMAGHDAARRHAASARWHSFIG